MSERGPNPPDRTDAGDGPTWRTYATDLISSAMAVALVGGLLFAVSGVWPPLVAIESQSMTPHIHVGDLVFVMDNDRFAGPGAQGSTGVVTAHAARETEYRSFGGYGDVIVYRPDGNAERTPVIHRAMFWVEAGENWYDRANPDYVGDASSCAETPHCPANRSGFITKGDANSNYDVVAGITAPVRPAWVIGTAETRVPALGQIRLRSGGFGADANTNTSGTVDATGSADVAASGNATASGTPSASGGTATPAAPHSGGQNTVARASA